MFNLLKLNVFIFLIIQMYIILIYILFIKIYVYRKIDVRFLFKMFNKNIIIIISCQALWR